MSSAAEDVGSGFKSLGDTATGVADAFSESITDSIQGISDSGGDMIRAIGRGDVGGALNDFLSINADVWNLASFGTLNASIDAFKRFIEDLIPEADFQDRKNMVRDASKPIRFIYGSARVGGVVRYIESSGTDSRYLHVICIFAAHECQSIDQVYFGDELVVDAGTIVDKYSAKVTYIQELGAQTSANAGIVADTPDGWTNDHKLLGHTYAYFKLDYDTALFRGVPNISAVIRGKNDIYDPRTQTTGYTDNHALCVRDWIIHPLGMNAIPDGGTFADVLDEQSFIDAANTADELVASGVGTTEKRYTVNGSISIEAEPINALRSLLKAGAADYQYVQGKYRVIAGDYAAPESPNASSNPNFNESDLIGGISFAPTQSAASSINAVKGTFIDPDQDYEPVDFVQLIVDEYVDEDKQEMFADTKFQFTNTSTMARRLSKIALEQSRYGVSVDVTLKYRALEYSKGDRITLSIDQFGWVEKVFKINELSFTLTNGVQLSLSEDAPSIWSWEEGDALAVDAPPLLNLPDPTLVDVPTNLSAVESLFLGNDQKTVKSRVSFAWDGSTGVQRWELQASFNGAPYIVLSDFLSTPSFEMNDLEVGAWVFKLRAVNSLNAKSDFIELPFTTVGKTAPPADVTSFSGATNPFNIEFKWDSIPDLDLDYYELRLGSSWASGEVIQKINATRWIWETRPTGTERVFIKAFDTSGNESLVETEALFSISAPSAVAPVTAQIIDNNVLLRWADATSSFAIDSYTVKRGPIEANSEVVGTVKSTFTSVFELEANTYTYWVAGVDVQGNVGPFSSVTANVDAPPDFTLQSNAFLDLTLGTKTNMLTETGQAVTLDQDNLTFDDTAVTFDSDQQIALIAPVNIAETWTEHFEALPGHTDPLTFDSDLIKFDSDLQTFDEGYQSVKDLHIDNGYPLYLQPTPATADYEQTIDFGGVLALSRIQLQPDVDILDGTTAIDYTVSYSSDDISYTDTAGLEAVGINFRYVKIKIDVTSATGIDLVRFNSLRLRLDVKLKTDQGNATAAAGDVSGTQVNFNVPFVDVESIQVTPKGTGAVNAVYDFVDAPNPTDFSVYLFDSAGARVSGDFSWTTRGV